MDEMFIYKLFDNIIYDGLSQGYDKNAGKIYYEVEYEERGIKKYFSIEELLKDVYSKLSPEDKEFFEMKCCEARICRGN